MEKVIKLRFTGECRLLAYLNRVFFYKKNYLEHFLPNLLYLKTLCI